VDAKVWIPRFYLSTNGRVLGVARPSQPRCDRGAIAADKLSVDGQDLEVLQERRHVSLLNPGELAIHLNLGEHDAFK
jgi:hypothetical protein